MSSRRQKLWTRVNWYLQLSLKHITEYITGDKFYNGGGRYRQVSLYYTHFTEWHCHLSPDLMGEWWPSFRLCRSAWSRTCHIATCWVTTTQTAPSSSSTSSVPWPSDRYRHHRPLTSRSREIMKSPVKFQNDGTTLTLYVLNFSEGT